MIKPKTVLQWLGVICLLVMAFDIQAPKLPIGGGGVFHDSTSTMVTLNKGFNVNGTLLVNGSPVSGADVSFDTVLSAKKDTARFGSLKRSNVWLNSNSFTETLIADGIYSTGTIATETVMECDALAVNTSGFVDSLLVVDMVASGSVYVGGTTTHVGDVNNQGLVKNGSGDDWTYNYLWRGVLTNGTTPYFNMAHGMTRRQYQNIKGWTVAIHHDTTTADKGIYTNTHWGSHTFYLRIDSTNLKWEGVTAFKGDSCFINFTLTNYPERTPFP